MAKGNHRPGGGIRSKTVVHKPVRTGAPREHIQKAGVAQLGQAQGSHATDKGDTGYRGIGLRGPKHPISERLGNEVAATTVCGVGGSRTSTKQAFNKLTAASIRANQCRRKARSSLDLARSANAMVVRPR
jgi:hypothetical protein